MANEADYAEALRLIRKHMQPGDKIGMMFVRVAKELEAKTEYGEVCAGCGKLLICRHCGKFRSAGSRQDREKAAIDEAKRTGKSVTYVDDDGCEVQCTPSGHAFYNAADWY